MTRVAFVLLALLGACAGEPVAEAPILPGTATVALGETARFGSLAVTPLRVEEDSRCPVSVQCVHAGTVRIAIRTSDSGAGRDLELTLGTPVSLGGAWLTLAAACPYPGVPGPIRQSAYRFNLVVGQQPASPRHQACPGPAA
jgi:hypothetical protein